MIKRFLLVFGVFGVFAFFITQEIFAQGSGYGYDNNGNIVSIDGKLTGKDFPNVITTAVPFLTISPDARSGGMGEVGVAISPDANSMYWNAAKLAFSEKDMGFALSYTPWLRKLGINDMSLSYLAGYKKLSKQEAIGISMNYFNMGSIQFTNADGSNANLFNPKEYSFAVTYSRKLSEKLSLAPTIKYIHSNLSGNLTIPGSTTITKPGNAAAVDLGVYYTTDSKVQGMDTKISFGAVISNFGSKITYTTNSNRDFIPTNLKLGGAYQIQVDQYSKFVIAADANKLLVPTPPVSDGQGGIIGRDPNRSMFSGVFGSFTDAPAGGKEELREVILCGAVEYWYNDLFAIRGGYFHENKFKGNRKYFTLGLGIRYEMFGIDFAYLVPVVQNNPLAETLRFTLHFDFATKKREEDILIEE